MPRQRGWVTAAVAKAHPVPHLHGRVSAGVVLHIALHGKADLAQVAQTLRHPRVFLGLPQRRQEHSDEYGNNSDGQQKLDESEAAAGLPSRPRYGHLLGYAFGERAHGY